MNTSRASKVIPIILTALTLATAVFFYKQRQVLRQKTQELLSQSAEPTSKQSPTPSVANLPLAETPIVSPTVTPETNETNGSNLTNKPNVQTTKTVASVTVICTPVYGMANTCAEHAVVDTALDTSIFYNLAGMSYLFGLGAFIKAKKRA